MNYIILENIRSAYNVWNIIRTADALGRGVVISWYTPHPDRNSRVSKSALWADKSVDIIDFGITPESPYWPRNMVYPLPKDTKKIEYIKNFYWTSSIAEEYCDNLQIKNQNNKKIINNVDIENKKTDLSDIFCYNKENSMSISNHIPTQDAINWSRDNDMVLIVAEKTESSINIKNYEIKKHSNKSFAVVLGNEVNGVKKQTIEQADMVLHIDMLGTKSSLNVWQAGAIFMWEIWNNNIF